MLTFVLCAPSCCCRWKIVTKTYFVLEYPLYNPIKCTFICLFHNIVLGCLKCHFQSDHQIDTTWCIFQNTLLYLTKATTLHYSRKLVFMTPSCCTPCVISLLASWILKTRSFHFHKGYLYNNKQTFGLVSLWGTRGVHWRKT